MYWLGLWVYITCVMLMFESICNTSTFHRFLSRIYFDFLYAHLILFTALMNYKWIIIMTVQGDSVSFCLLFNHLITVLSSYHIFADSFLIFHRDFTNPNLPTEQKGRPPQVCFVWLFIYLSIFYQHFIYLLWIKSSYWSLWSAF